MTDIIIHFEIFTDISWYYNDKQMNPPKMCNGVEFEGSEIVNITHTQFDVLKIVLSNNGKDLLMYHNNLLMFVENLESPTLVDIKTAKLLYDNQLATFIDARDSDSFKNQHIFSSINIPYDLIEKIESDYDLNYLIELNENFIINVKLDDYSFFIGLECSLDPM